MKHSETTIGFATGEEALQQSQVSMTHERAGRILAGVSVLATIALGYLFDQSFWFLLTIGTALSLLFSGMTDKCAVKNLLIKLGFPGERDLGRAEGQRR